MSPFWTDFSERLVRAFAQGMLAALGVGAVTSPVTSLPWLTAVEVGASAAAVSVLMSLAALKTGDGTASLVAPMKTLFRMAPSGPELDEDHF